MEVVCTSPEITFLVTGPEMPKVELPEAPALELSHLDSPRVKRVFPKRPLLIPSPLLDGSLGDAAAFPRIESVYIQADADHISIACPRCRASFDVAPTRMLECNHTFCHTCVVQLCKDGRVTCPRCKKVTPVAAGGVEALRPNYALGGLCAPLADLHVGRLQKRRGTDMLLDDIGATCPVCMESFARGGRVATVLGCGHSLCHGCCDALNEKARDAAFECPTCRMMTCRAQGCVNQSLDKAIARILEMRTEAR